MNDEKIYYIMPFRLLIMKIMFPKSWHFQIWSKKKIHLELITNSLGFIFFNSIQFSFRFLENNLETIDLEFEKKISFFFLFFTMKRIEKKTYFLEEKLNGFCQQQQHKKMK